MSITDELREWAKTLTHWWYDPVKDEYTYTTGTMPPSIDAIRLDSSIIAIADRIDAEHKKAVASVMNDALYHVNEKDMAELGWVRLPKDADGEPIHVGDKLIDEDNKLQKPAIVKCILYNDEGCVVSNIDPRGCWYDPSLLRHHHAPTVEDVLREFAEKMNENLGMYTGEAIDADEWRSADAKTIAEYAKRLTLAEGEGDGRP